MKPTPEQDLIIRHTASKRIVVDAKAGSGKTTTCVMYAQARPSERILYVAYNRSVKEEAIGKFPHNVKVVTAHGLAFSRIGFNYMSNIGEITPHDIVQKKWLGKSTDLLLAKKATDALYAWLHSGERCLQSPMFGSLDVVEKAAELWSKVTASECGIPMPHDGYLKLYQLSKPILSNKYDTIILDEAQDANGAILDIIKSQKCNQVYVGDEHQQIYAYRHAVNAMSSINGATRFSLSESFRFGADLALAAAHVIYAGKKLKLNLIGSASKNTVLLSGASSAAESGVCYISRTNAGVINAASEAVKKGMKIRFVGGIQGYNLPFIMAVYNFKEKGNNNNPRLRHYPSYTAMLKIAGESKDVELLSIIGIVKKHGRELPSIIKRITKGAVDKPVENSITVCTAHKSKGLEFDSVQLADDFVSLQSPQCTNEDANLLYVAVTRAIHCLILNKQLTRLLS